MWICAQGERWTEKERLDELVGDRAADAIRGESVVSAVRVVEQRRDEFNNLSEFTQRRILEDHQ